MTLKLVQSEKAAVTMISCYTDHRIYDRDDIRINRKTDKNIFTSSDDLTLEDDKNVEAQARIHDDSMKNDLNEKKEFFVKYRGKTYEISGLLNKHPGGRSLGAFRGLPLDKVLNDVPHSDAAYHLFEEFLVENQREYNNIEDLVDWNAPLLGQVGNLADRYWEWVNLPVNRSIRLFKSNFLEYLTVTPWYLVPMVWIPLSIYFLYLGFVTNSSKNVQNSLTTVLLSVSLGILLWTLIEYVLHRNLFHMKPSPNSKILITLHFLLHGLHHKAPFDDQRLLFPPAAAILVASIFYKMYKAVLPEVMIDSAAAGTMIGYLCYDLIHYYLHYGAPKAESYLYIMKRYHNHHHFSHHDQGFGISSRLWDFAFGSLIKLKRLRKPIVW